MSKLQTRVAQQPWAPIFSAISSHESSEICPAPAGKFSKIFYLHALLSFMVSSLTVYRMIQPAQREHFTAPLLRPAEKAGPASWAFVLLPKPVSETLPRRGRTTVIGRINGHPFQATLEPDGQLSHWLRVDEELQMAAGLKPGEMVSLEIEPIEEEPEPEVPADFQAALDSNEKARRVWRETTKVARLDWVHWMTSAKQANTRLKRIREACEMLAAGKKRVCCFDSSGFYSKAFRAPAAAK
jgi:hypothetical protein